MIFRGIRKPIILFLISALTLQIGLFAFPKKSEAVVVPVLDAPNLAANTKKLVTYFQKEFTLDALAYLLAKTLIRQMTTSVVNWINSGFQGNPSFVTNPAQFLTDTADQIAGRFIEGSELGFLCDPFRLDIRLALGLQYSPFKQQISCTLSKVIQNAQNAGEGFLAQGGWDGWLQITTVPQNNVYGAFLLAQSELNARIVGKQNIELKKLEFGRGFFSWEKCEYYGEGGSVPVSESQAKQEFYDLGYSDSEAESAARSNAFCQTETPGSVIEGQINQILPSGLRQLELADEFNEIINALAVQLIQQAVGGGGGLRSASARVGGRPSLTERLNTVIDSENIRNLRESLTSQINADIENENSFKTSKQASVDQLSSARQALGQLISCYQGKITNGVVGAFGRENLTGSEMAIAQGQINLASTTIVSRIEPDKARLLTDIQKASTAIGELSTIKGRVSSASTIQAIQDVSTAYQAISNGGSLHRIDETIEAQGELTRVSGEMATLFQETSRKVEECLNFPQRNRFNSF